MNTLREFLSSISPSDCIELQAGDYLFRQNDPTRGLFFIKQGRVKLTRDSIDGHAIILHIAQSNDSLAEASLFTRRYHCNARADIPSSIELFDKTVLLKHLADHPDAAMQFIERLTQQIQQLRQLIELRGVRSPKQRLLNYLQLNADEHGEIRLRSTYKDLAISLGMTHETLYRVLRQLEQEAVLQRNAEIIILLI